MIQSTQPSPFAHAPIRPDWLALRAEPILEPELPIVDPHHHLWDRPGSRYLAHELFDDLNGGHGIRATVYIQNRAMFRASGPAALAPLGEVEFVNGVAAMGASGQYGPARACDAIVGAADLALGDAVLPVLEAMAAVAGGRLRGIRNPTAWHADPALQLARSPGMRTGMLAEEGFRRGAAHLARFGLVLDVWAYHTQLDEVYGLAAGLPDVTVVVDHFGGPLAVGPHAADLPGMRAQWQAAMRRLATLPNVRVKLGGGGMPVFGFGFERDDVPPASAQLAAALAPYVEQCICWFGVERCMFESNFPVDKGMFSYAVLWNAFKRIAQGYSPGEKAALFRGTAAATYRLEVPA